MGDFKMPSLGADMEAGTLVEWLKASGDQVHRGDTIAVVETEKGAIEIEIFEDGQIDKLVVAPGTKVPVGTVLATLVGGKATSAEAPRRVRTPIQPPKPIVLPSASITSAAGIRVRASPAARRIASERGFDLEKVQGTGPQGAITSVDLAAAVTPVTRDGGPDMEPMRRAIAAAMSRSKREIPHYYLSHSMDVGSAQAWLEHYNAKREPAARLLFAALLIKASAIALVDFPEFNGFYEAGSFKPSIAIHVGLAIAVRGGGLAAPAIHDSDRLALPDLMTKMRDLVGRVRRGSFRSSEISDPTVTISSLGERGVETLFPVIYPPQVAILGFGAMLPRPWSIDGHVRTRPVITASLAADHRVSNGHRGALLLQRIDTLLSQPEALQ